MRLLPSLALILSLTAPALADLPRPQPRPGLVPVSDAATAIPRPQPRPGRLTVDAAQQTVSTLAPRATPRPPRGPGALVVPVSVAPASPAPALVPPSLAAPALAAPPLAIPAPEPEAAPLPSAPDALAIPLREPAATDFPPADLGLTETLAALALRGARLMPTPDALLAKAGAAPLASETVLSASNAPVPTAVVLPASRLATSVSPRPRQRPEVASAARAAPLVQAAFVSPRRPLARPAASLAPAPAVAVLPTGLTSPRPAARPKGLQRRAAPEPSGAQITLAAAAPRIDPGRTLVKPKKGALCGDPSIKGERLAPIPARVQGCGIAEPVRVTEVAGVRLSPAATVDCAAARALSTWVTKGLKPAVGRAGVSELKIAASYACRTRNNVRGARISEHGRGNAIDISAVVLGNGKRLDVLGGYRREPALRAAHKAACGIFGTTLGPGSDGYHENHLHFDVARYRGGPYCR